MGSPAVGRHHVKAAGQCSQPTEDKRMRVDFSICAPGGDTAFLVEYDYCGYYIDGISVNGEEFDPGGLFVSIPKGKLDAQIVRLEDYLLTEAERRYQEDALEIAQGRKDYWAEQNCSE